jgi:hypothetical protein
MGGAKRYPSIAFDRDDGFRRLNPSYELELMFLFIPIGPQQIFETHCIWFKALAEQCRR